MEKYFFDFDLKETKIILIINESTILQNKIDFKQNTLFTIINQSPIALLFSFIILSLYLLYASLSFSFRSLKEF
jgi:hypothetical protein